MENLKIQYAPHVPMVDFAPFLNSNELGLPISRIIEGAKGNIVINKSCSKMDCYEAVFSEAMKYVGKFLRNWNGWTWRWYVEEFMRRVGIHN